jgi:hypothetical protein
MDWLLEKVWDEPSPVIDLWAPPQHEYLPRLFVLLPFG